MLAIYSFSGCLIVLSVFPFGVCVWGGGGGGGLVFDVDLIVSVPELTYLLCSVLICSSPLLLLVPLNGCAS